MWAHNGTVTRKCRAIPQQVVVKRSHMAFSKKILLDTTPELAVNSAKSFMVCQAWPTEGTWGECVMGPACNFTLLIVQ